MQRRLAIGIGVLLSTAAAVADDPRSGSGRSLTVGPDPFRAGSQVVRDRATAEPLYRIEPDPFQPGQQRIEEYGSGNKIGEIRPDPFGSDDAVIDRRD